MGKNLRIAIVADSTGAAVSNSRMRWDARAAQSAARKADRDNAAARQNKAYRESDAVGIAAILNMATTD